MALRDHRASHYLNGYFDGRPDNPSAVPPRRLRETMPVDPKGRRGYVDLTTDTRIHYNFDMDDGVSEAIWVSAGRAGGWQDTSQNSYHLNAWQKNFDYIKPYYSSSYSALNDQPGIYFPGVGWPTALDGCVLYRDNDDVIKENRKDEGFLFMMVFNIAEWYDPYTNDVSWFSRFPYIYWRSFYDEALPTMYVSLGLNAGSDNPGGAYEAHNYLYVPWGRIPDEDTIYVLTAWLDMKNYPGMITLRLNGATENIEFLHPTDHGDLVQWPDVPGSWHQLLFGGTDNVNFITATFKWYWGGAFLGYGDFEYAEVDYLERRYMNHYGVERAA